MELYHGTARATATYKYEEFSFSCNDKSKDGETKSVSSSLEEHEGKATRDSAKSELRSRLHENAGSECWKLSNIEYHIKPDD